MDAVLHGRRLHSWHACMHEKNTRWSSEKTDWDYLSHWVQSFIKLKVNLVSREKKKKKMTKWKELGSSHVCEGERRLLVVRVHALESIRNGRGFAESVPRCRVFVAGVKWILFFFFSFSFSFSFFTLSRVNCEGWKMHACSLRVLCFRVLYLINFYIEHLFKNSYTSNKLLILSLRHGSPA